MKYSAKIKKIHFLSPLILQTLIWIPTRIFLKTFYNYKIKGLDNIRKLKINNNGVIFAVNHSSELDPILIPASLPFLSRLMPMFYVAREQKFYKNSGWRQNLYGGLLFRLWGAHTVYAGMRDYNISLRYHIKLLSKGKSLCIFPEGFKTRDGNITVNGKPGIGFLVHNNKSTVIPVKIKGAYSLNKESDCFGRRKIEVKFGEPIYAEELIGNLENAHVTNYKRMSFTIMKEISNL